MNFWIWYGGIGWQSKNMAFLVQKYGGTSVANLERIQKVADRVAESRRKGNRLVVVVSAMSGVTDGLLKMARGLHAEPSDGIAHGGEIDEEGYASEVLQNDARDGEGNFFRGRFLSIPAGKILDIAGASRKAVAVAKD